MDPFFTTLSDYLGLGQDFAEAELLSLFFFTLIKQHHQISWGNIYSRQDEK